MACNLPVTRSLDVDVGNTLASSAERIGVVTSVKPVTANSVLSRIQAVIYRPRAFVKTEAYNGPCRRRVVDPKFQGPFRRASDAAAKGENAA